MKKMLMLAACASQLLLLPQINAMNNNERFKEIIVSQNFEIDNGVQGLQRDTYSEVARSIVMAPGAIVAKIRHLYGLSEEALALTTSEHPITGFKLVLLEAYYRITNTFQHRITRILNTFRPRRTKKIVGYKVSEETEETDVDGCFIGADGVATLAFYSNGRYSYLGHRNFIFENYALRSCGKGKTLRPSVRNLSNKYEGTILSIKCVNGKFFALSQENEYNNNICLAKSVNKDSIDWGISFSSLSKCLLSGIENRMAYGDKKYVIILDDGTSLIKPENNEAPWEKHDTSISEMVKKMASYNAIERVRVAYGNDMFALSFYWQAKVHFYTSQDGKEWDSKIIKEGYAKIPTSFVGCSFGFALTNVAGQLCYSKSFDDLIKAEGNGFSKVFCLNTSFGYSSFNCMFVALKNRGTDISLGIPVRKNDNSSYVKWFKTGLMIYFPSESGELELSTNKGITNIFSNTNGDIIITGVDVYNKKYFACL